MTVPPHELRARLLTATERSLAASSDFDLNPLSKEKRAASLRDAAVLIGVYSSVDGPCVLLTRRAACGCARGPCRVLSGGTMS